MQRGESSLILIIMWKCVLSVSLFISRIYVWWVKEPETNKISSCSIPTVVNGGGISSKENLEFNFTKQLKAVEHFNNSRYNNDYKMLFNMIARSIQHSSNFTAHFTKRAKPEKRLNRNE